MVQIGGVYTTLCHEEGILLQKYRDRNGRCVAILFKSIGVRGRFDSPEKKPSKLYLPVGPFAAAIFGLPLGKAKFYRFNVSTG